MGVPATIPPAQLAPERPEPARPGRCRPIGNVVVVIGVVAVALAVASSVMPQATRPPKDEQQSAAGPAVAPAAVQTVSHTVVYELHGRHGARNVTYAGEGASLAQQSEVDTPWSTTFVRTGPADRTEFYNLSAQNAGSGELRCRIVVDGVIVAEKTVSGEGALFSCTA